MRFAEGRSSFAAFVAHYEHSAVFKVRQTQTALDVEGVLGLLGLDSNDREAPRYARALLGGNGELVATNLIVPGIATAPDPLFASRLTALFGSPNETRSRGQLLNQLRKAYQGIETPLDYAVVGPMFDACIYHGVIQKALDGVVRVYRLGTDY